MSWKRPQPKTIYLTLSVLPLIALTLFFQNCSGPFGSSSSWMLVPINSPAKDSKLKGKLSNKDRTSIEFTEIDGANEELLNTHQDLQKMEILKRPHEVRSGKAVREIIESESAGQAPSESQPLNLKSFDRKPTYQVPTKEIKDEIEAADQD